MSKKVTTESFIHDCQTLHGDRYDYSAVEYTTAHASVKIICKTHGEFSQAATTHKSGRGCSLCGKEKMSVYMTEKQKSKRVPVPTFCSRAKAVHGVKYLYDKVAFTHMNNKVTVTCPKHGDFKVEATKHLLGVGCKKCIVRRNGWSHTEWANRGSTSKEFDSFKVYILKLWSATEVFYKIGKTFKPVARRFRHVGTMPYEYEVLRIIEGSPKYISDLEISLHNENDQSKYIPDLKFDGRHECYSHITINGEMIW